MTKSEEVEASLPEDGFWYVSVGGNKTEIVRIHEGLMYSTGCADGHPLDGIELIEKINRFPPNKKEQDEMDRIWEKKKASRIKDGLPAYGYRTF